MNVFYMGEECLKTVSVPVEAIDDEIRQLVTHMFETMEREDGIGLAAPQVGKNIRLFIALVNGKEYVFINPQIIETSEETSIMEEGCLSIPKIYDYVTRPASVRVQFSGLDGKIRTLDAEGLLARVIQHENDHLNGILFIDRLEPEKKAALEKLFHQKQRARLKAKKKLKKNCVNLKK